jgi:hypothetical protein
MRSLLRQPIAALYAIHLLAEEGSSLATGIAVGLLLGILLASRADARPPG